MKQIIYDYGIINGMALKKPEDKTLEETMAYFKLVQMQDRWENYGSLDGIVDTKAVQKQLVNIVEKLRHHDDSIGLWKYLNR